MIRLEDLIASYRTGDSFATIELLCREPDAGSAADAFSAAANHFYWKDKDLPASVAMGRAGVQYALAAAMRLDPGEASLVSELRGKAKAMAYNLASFTWPGWGEPGIVIGPSDLVTGFDAARTNLRLAMELRKGALPMSRAHWILGAHELAATRHADAQTSFARACEQASEANSPAEHGLAVGFGILNEMLTPATHSPEAFRVLKERLEAAEARLKSLEHGEMFVQQIHTALGVFSKANDIG